MKFRFLFIVMLLFVACLSNNNDDFPEPDQFSGEDLYSQSSNLERILMGKWYYGYSITEYQDESVEIHYNSGTHWPTGDRTDSIQFYSNRMVGYSWDCPYENPSKQFVKLVESESASFFHWCFPSGVNGWLIENDTLQYYRGFNTDDFISYPIIEINNDSIYFLSRDWPVNSANGVDKEYAVFYKKQE
ncbi:hypothetical protein [Polaribacter sp. Hel1_33_49]|uniref:hypothetical protein n=1 Tax=Polaribacter sp. Hel1_33_49 TaxID=1336803 RepID=UPI00052C8DEB|nr:hypothetical protein [Polaribacter sp. Hel1_33_49]KGL61225.1 hypothetical protein PHEL49_2124 [Polaribacter sp. Hel1_33_49]